MRMRIAIPTNYILIECVVIVVPTMPCHTCLYFSQGGSYMLALTDTYAGGWNLLLVAIFECICIGYVYGE